MEPNEQQPPRGTALAGRIASPVPVNEPVRSYPPGSPERASLQVALAALSAERAEARMRIGDRDVESEETFPVVAPHRHAHVLADVHAATPRHVQEAVAAARAAAPAWAALPQRARSAVLLRAAELLAGPWRDRLNAATMLGQSKTAVQAEIDAACELADFWRFNCHFADEVLGEQPASSPGVWNTLDHRPLDGFVLALTPFNFTAIAGNLPTAPALMGNTVVWKPSEKQALAAEHTMRLLRAAGLPDGVINLVHGDGAMVSDVAMAQPDFAGLHYTGSTAVFRELWGKAASGLAGKRAYPRIVGETGGKDFVLAHPSAEVAPLVVALVRGAFEYQGQKCSAASRAYVPRSLWPAVREQLADEVAAITMGDVADLSHFMGAVISAGAYERLTAAVARAREEGAEVLVGGGADDTEGWFVEPTVLVTDDPRSSTMVTELFGPVLTVFVYEDRDWSATLRLADETSPYALTGAVFSTERAPIEEALAVLRHAAGNFYVNDKPTGAVVGQQPFGGSRASGTNDKAGSVLNLQRWVSPRTIKETLVPPTGWRYPHMSRDDSRDDGAA
jgi:1-pyrroline-5-carboxylate dehydrogenase